jgi:hypothetical protein
MQSDSRWLFDGVPVQTSEGAFIKWYDHQFFLLIHNGKKFHGEIVKDDSENNLLTIKINHRTFHVKKRGELDDLIASLGLDKPTSCTNARACFEDFCIGWQRNSTRRQRSLS